MSRAGVSSPKSYKNKLNFNIMEIFSIFFTITHLNDNARASTNLAGFAFFVDFAQTGPFTQFFVRVNVQQRNLMFVTEGSHQFLVLWFVATLGKDAQNSLTSKREVTEEKKR